MPGKQLRESTFHKQKEAEKKDEDNKPAISLSEGENLLSKFASGGKEPVGAEFIENLQTVNDSESSKTAHESGAAEEKNVREESSFEESSFTKEEPYEEPVVEEHEENVQLMNYIDEGPPSEVKIINTTASSGEQEVSEPIEDVVKHGEPSLDRPGDDPSHNIFGRVQPEKEEALPTAPSHAMTDAAKERVSKIAYGMIGGDIAINRLKEK